MIVVISEFGLKNVDKEKMIKWRELGYKINLDVQLESKKPYYKVNWALILNKTTQAVIFDIDKGYPDTKKMIEGTLYNGKKAIVLFKGKRYNLTSTKCHELDMLTKAFKEDYEDQQAAEDMMFLRQYKASVKQQAEELGIKLPNYEQVKDFVLSNAFEHDMKLDFSNETEVTLAYIQIQWYEQNALPHMNTENKIRCTACGKHTTKEFDGGPKVCRHCGAELEPEQIEDSIEFFGDLDYLDDILYNNIEESNDY